MRISVVAALLVYLTVAAGAAAQALPSGPAIIGGGRVVPGGDASVTIARTPSAWHEGHTRDTRVVSIPPQGKTVDPDFLVQ